MAGGPPVAAVETKDSKETKDTTRSPAVAGMADRTAL